MIGETLNTKTLLDKLTDSIINSNKSYSDDLKGYSSYQDEDMVLLIYQLINQSMRNCNNYIKQTNEDVRITNELIISKISKLNENELDNLTVELNDIGFDTKIYNATTLKSLSNYTLMNDKQLKKTLINIFNL